MKKARSGKHNPPFNTKNRPIDYRIPKKAFDDVMDCYPVQFQGSLLGSDTSRQQNRDRIAAELFAVIPVYDQLPPKDRTRKRGQGTLAAKGTAVRNPTAPTMIDFKIDVEAQIRKVIRNRKHIVAFIVRYILGVETLNKSQQHLFARYEQQLGRLFIKAKIWPVNRYFISIREKQ